MGKDVERYRGTSQFAEGQGGHIGRKPTSKNAERVRRHIQEGMQMAQGLGQDISKLTPYEARRIRKKAISSVASDALIERSKPTRNVRQDVEEGLDLHFQFQNPTEIETFDL
ncbi:hypothetical protein M1615_02730 [Patescibacteria group bacterium]|nr:hypothetical protein [Patescibacteria group bacterium]